MMLAGTAIATALFLIGLFAYEHYAAENPILDLIYEWRLRRQDLAALDRAAAENPRRVPIIVTFTTLPSRVERIDLTLKSLLRQTVRPDAIRLNLPDASRREGAPYVLPERIRTLTQLTIVPCADYGPATKVIPALFDSPADAALLVVDDDRVYQPSFVERMARLAGRHPDAAIASSGWDVPDDLVDRPTTLAATLFGRPPAPIKCTRVRGCREVDVFQGLAGYVVRPRFFDREAIADYTRAPTAAFFVDDVWISAHCRARKLVCAGPRTNFPSALDARFYKRSSLGLVNRGDGTNESRNNTIMLRYFADRWRHRQGA